MITRKTLRILVITQWKGILVPHRTFRELRFQVTPESAYASLFEIDDGSELKFIPTVTINGVKCAKILEKKGIKCEVLELCCVVLCTWANPPYSLNLKKKTASIPSLPI